MNLPPLGQWGYFTLLSELGRGTTGVVYKAQNRHLNNRLCAIKTLLPCPRAELIERRERFLREARVMASLCDHAHIVALFQVSEYEGHAHCVREFVDGSTLETLVAEKSIDLRTGLRLLSQVCEATAAVHARGFAHRTLIPSNVLVDSANGTHRAKLIGFGHVGMLAGSSHLPPGARGTSPMVDVQALYQMLHCLASTLGEPLPAELAALDLLPPAALADALRRHS